MSVIQVFGRTSLAGEISVQGSKNAVLPMMAAALLHRGITVLTNVPEIGDVACMVEILRSAGCRCSRRGDTLVMDGTLLTDTSIPERYVRAMRSSIIVLGALLGRMGEGRCCYPGGCLIGSRPIDLHLMVLRALGAQIQEREGWLEAACAGGLKGAELTLPYPSVGATEQALLAAVLAEGVTVVHGAAKEPEITQLCHCLNGMGAVICGMGTSHLMIQGVRRLHDSTFAVEGDRIVAGTYSAAVAAAGGRVRLKGIRPSWLSVPFAKLEEAGVAIRRAEEEGWAELWSEERPRSFDLTTGPYPEFPTDLQSPYMALLAGANGVGRVEERVFDGRFATAEFLMRMGADIRLEGRTALVRGVRSLHGASVRARDLRGGAALAVAALAAEGETRIEDCCYIRRGYEDICRDLSALGARIRWISEEG